MKITLIWIDKKFACQSNKTLIQFSFKKVYSQGHRSGLNQNVFSDDNSSVNQ